MPIALLLGLALLSSAAATERTVTRPLSPYQRLLGGLSAKSVVATGHGHVLAQNMLYTHTVTVFDADGARLADISDKVAWRDVGMDRPGTVRGAPVEAAVTHDGKTAFVSNYALFGKGVGASGAAGAVTDACAAEGKRPSLVYRIDVDSARITAAYPVGATPKFLALNARDDTLVVSNWCSGDVTVLDVRDGTVRGAVRVGPNPRGVAFDSAGHAFVTVMGNHSVAVIDLRTLVVEQRFKPGRGPRHLVTTPQGTLLLSLSWENAVVELDPRTGAVLRRVRTGRDPRSIALSADGSALYVVNYGEDTLAVVDTATFAVVARHGTGPRPVGVTFEPTRERVWVSCYGGSIRVFDTHGAPMQESMKVAIRQALKAKRDAEAESAAH